MWYVTIEPEQSAECSMVRGKDGHESWLVVVRKVFDGLLEAEIPGDLHRHSQGSDEHLRKPAMTDALWETDLKLTKPGTDVLLHASAYAPGGRPTPRVDVSLRFNGHTKTLAVFGDRTWRPGLFSPSLSEPAPFVTMPIRYERAYGGTDGDTFDARNPIGVGFATAAAHLAGRPAPNVEHPDALISSWRDRPRPAGFGPIPRHWSPRRELAGTYDERWEAERAPLLPEDFHDDFFYSAPEDQRVPGQLREGSVIELLNLTPSGHLRVTLPKVRPTFRTYFGRDAVDHGGRLHTVILEPDESRLIMVWHTALRCHGREHKLERTVVRMKDYV